MKTSKIETATGVVLSAQVGDSKPYIVELSHAEFAEIESVRRGHWRRWISNMYGGDIRFRARLAGDDVALSLVTSARWWVVFALALGGLGAAAAGFFFGRASVAAGASPSFPMDEQHIRWAITEGVQVEERDQARIFERCSELRIREAIPLAVVTVSQRSRDERGARVAVEAAQRFLESYGVDDIRAALVEYHALVGAEPDALMYKLEGVLSR